MQIWTSGDFNILVLLCVFDRELSFACANARIFFDKVWTFTFHNSAFLILMSLNASVASYDRFRMY